MDSDIPITATYPPIADPELRRMFVMNEHEKSLDISSQQDHTTPMNNTPANQPTVTRWIVQHSTSDGYYTIADNFISEANAREFASRQQARGRIIVSVVRDDNFRLDF